MDTPPKGDASMILFYQLAAAKLNVASGASNAAVSGTIASADAWLSAHAGPLPLHVPAASADGAIAVGLGGTLDQYNNGQIGPGHCK
jgi:hypothetical protein